MTPTRRSTLAGLALAAASLPARAEDSAVKFAAHDPASRRTVDHAAWAQLLAAYVRPHADGVNRVDYAGLKSRGLSMLAAYVAALEAVDLSALPRPEQFAFWANLYNALTVKVVAEAYPVASIRDIGSGLFSLGPWGRKVATVAGHALSLDDIEHGILRKLWQDSRVHYAVNCASIGCPNLRMVPFAGATLDADLDDAARAYVNHPRGVWFEEGGVYTSSIYRWYREDFGGSRAGVLEHLRRYAADETASRLARAATIAGDDYDWTLNGV